MESDVVADVTWSQPGLLAKVIAFFRARAPRVLSGQLVADRTGLAIHAEGVHGALLRWAWHDITDLELESGVANYLVVETTERPRRSRFALVLGGGVMHDRDATALLGRIRQVASSNGWSPSAVAAQSDAGPRAHRLAANTAAFVRRHPDAYVVRTAVAPNGSSRAAMTVGMTFASVTRFGHLVADASGLRMFQGPNDLEWEKSWREILTLARSDDERSIKLEALGWEMPKFYSPCEPNGDVLLPFAVKDVLAQLRARRPGAGVR